MPKLQCSLLRQACVVISFGIATMQPLPALDLSWTGNQNARWEVAENWFSLTFNTTRRALLPFPIPDIPKPQIIRRVPQDGDTAHITASESGDTVFLTEDTALIDGLTLGGGIILRSDDAALRVDKDGGGVLKITGADSQLLLIETGNPESVTSARTDNLSIEDGGTLALDGGRTVVDGIAEIHPESVLVGHGSVFLDNTVHGPGALVLTNGGRIEASGGDLTIRANSGVEIDLDGAFETGHVVVQGDASLLVDGLLHGRFHSEISIGPKSRCEIRGNLRIGPEGRLEISGGTAENFAGVYTGQALEIAGTLKVRRKGVIECPVVFETESSIDLELVDNSPSTLLLHGNTFVQDAVSFSGGGILAVQEGAVLSVSSGATVGASVYVHQGTLAIGKVGAARIDGFYEQHSESALRVKIVEDTADTFHITNRATLGGSLELDFLEFTPKLKERWEILHADGGVRGTFDHVVQPKLPEGLALEVTYEETYVTVHVVRKTSRQRLGDCNQDGTLNLSDPSCLLEHLFLGGASLPCEGGTIRDEGNLALLDSNDSGTVDLSDALHVLTFLFLGGPPPVGQSSSCTTIPSCPDACTADDGPVEI